MKKIEKTHLRDALRGLKDFRRGQGRMYPVDAMHTQKETLQAIIVYRRCQREPKKTVAPDRV